MPYKERKKIIADIQKKREGRTLISLCNFDRLSEPPLPGISIPFQADLKECLYRVLKESKLSDKGIDIFLYTRGGDTNSVWPIVSLLREYDKDFQVLIPFRAHSAGTLLSLASKNIVMTRLAELSPIDPSTGNQFNPIDPINNRNRLGISVEDVNAYKDFIKGAFNFKDQKSFDANEMEILKLTIEKLTQQIHPLALGNVHRVHTLIKRLAERLLKLHREKGFDVAKVITELTVEPGSHLHMFSRSEALDILGKDFIVFADYELETLLDQLLRQYEDDFDLRSTLYLSRLMDDNSPEKDFRFIGGALESNQWGYLFETICKAFQSSKVPSNITIQVPAGQPMPLIPGLPREYRIDIKEQRWCKNIEPKGVTK